MKAKFKIKPFTNPSGDKVFRVDGNLNGTRVRKNFDSMEEALTQKQNWECAALNMPRPAVVATRLTPEQCGEAEACYRLLAGQLLTLTGAVQFALRNYVTTEKTITVADALPLFLADKERSKQDGLADATRRKLRDRLRRLVTTLGERLVGQITADDLKPLIFREGSGAHNQHSEYSTFRNFFNWAVFSGYCAVNPMNKVQAVRLVYGEPVVFTLAESRRLMAWAQQPVMSGVTNPHELPSLVPFLVLALFCGVRVKEIARLQLHGGWDNVDLDARTITIGPKVAKGRSRRVVDIPVNALNFLAEHAVERAPFMVPNMRHRFVALREKAGLAEWTQDVMRHTAITYRLAKTNDEGATAGWAGNSPNIIHKHYRGLVKAADVPQFWDIQPGQMDIIELKQAEAA